jgi:hypothetical protein
MTSSSSRSDLDLARDIPTTAADIEALSKVRAARSLSTDQYLRALTRLEAPPLEVLRTRKRARDGEPFSLPGPVGESG